MKSEDCEWHIRSAHKSILVAVGMKHKDFKFSGAG